MFKQMASLLVVVGLGSALVMLAGNGSPALALAMNPNVEEMRAAEAQPVGTAPPVRAPGDPFPPGGTDYIYGTSGDIYVEVTPDNIYGLDPETWYFAIQPGPPNETVVERQEPSCTPYCTIDMEITQMNLVASDGIIGMFVFLAPSPPSTGQVVEPSTGDPGDFPADSFFDVYVEVEIPYVTPNRLRNTDSIRLEAPGIVELPPWNEAYEVPVGWLGVELYDGTVPTGLWIRYVIHVNPPPPPECEPDPLDNYQSCIDVDCTLLGFPPEYVCVPTRINWDPANDTYIILECECMDPDDCHVEPGDVGAPPYCVGGCPDGEVCTEYQQDAGGGTVDYWCQCDPVQPPCDISGDMLSCEGYCPPTQPECQITRLLRSPSGTWEVEECTCVDPNNDCYLSYDELVEDQVWCEGTCPAPLVCTLMSRGAASGYIEFWCECHDPANPPPCGPVAGLTCEGACPGAEACVPAEFQEKTPPATGLMVTACECRGFDDCRGYSNLIDPVTCAGWCPPDEDCNLVALNTDPLSYRCECESQVTEACCFGDGRCEDHDPVICTMMGGWAQGAATACTGAVEACCLEDGTCVMVEEICCDDLNGTAYPGEVCTQIEACCFDDGSCLDLDPVCCLDQNGSPQGAATACTGTLEACCLEDGTCRDTDPLCCDELDGTLSGEPACLGDNNDPPNGIDDACEDCDVDPTMTFCQEVFCPPTYQCLPTRLLRALDGTWEVETCECVNADEDCWLGYDAADDQVWCEGTCPAPLVCTLISRGAASGYIEFWCECHPPDMPPPCGPQGTPPFVCEGACPPDTACVISEYQWDPGANRMVATECECRGFDECRGYGSLTNPPPDCQGDCPPGEICELIEIDADGDQVIDTWRCECETECRPLPDGSDCEQVICPDPVVEECVPTQVRGWSPGPSFPPGGTDTLIGTTGLVEIEFDGGDVRVYTIDPASALNLTVVQRQDPQGGGGGGGAATIDMDITQMNFDANDGMLKVYVSLAPSPPSTGQVIGYGEYDDFPAESFFDVYVTIDLPDVPGAIGLYNQDPIPIGGGGIYSIPPYEVPFETGPDWPGVELYEPAGGLGTGHWIRRVIHALPPPPPWEIIECECLDPGYCHIQLPQVEPGEPWCDGGCPPGYICEQERLVTPEGWATAWCECDCACGDINHSGGVIDLSDFGLFALCYGLTAPNVACPEAEFYCSDMDRDHDVDLSDFGIFAIVYGTTPTHTPPDCLLP